MASFARRPKTVVVVQVEGRTGRGSGSSRLDVGSVEAAYPTTATSGDFGQPGKEAVQPLWQLAPYCCTSRRTPPGQDRQAKSRQQQHWEAERKIAATLSL